MRLRLLAGLLMSAAPIAHAQSVTEQYRATADKIIQSALSDSAAWNRIAELTEKFGNRFSGSQSLEQAIDWIMVKMKEDGLANVRGESAMVPHWASRSLIPTKPKRWKPQGASPGPCHC